MEDSQEEDVERGLIESENEPEQQRTPLATFLGRFFDTVLPIRQFGPPDPSEAGGDQRSLPRTALQRLFANRFPVVPKTPIHCPVNVRKNTVKLDVETRALSFLYDSEEPVDIIFYSLPTLSAEGELSQTTRSAPEGFDQCVEEVLPEFEEVPSESSPTQTAASQENEEIEEEDPLRAPHRVLCLIVMRLHTSEGGVEKPDKAWRLTEQHTVVSEKANGGILVRQLLKFPDGRFAVSAEVFDTESDGTCVVCLEETPTVLLYPCSHLVVCSVSQNALILFNQQECAEALRTSTHACPVCRAPLRGLINVEESSTA